jgi:hypothetical protein
VAVSDAMADEETKFGLRNFSQDTSYCGRMPRLLSSGLIAEDLSCSLVIRPKLADRE